MPRQERALRTVEAIFEATARILEREGLASVSTNRIAETAGVSIGSLYQYFANRDAILIAMARRELERDRAAMHRALAEIDTGSSAADLARATIRTLIRLHRSRLAVRRQIMQVHLAHGLGEEHVAPVKEIAQRIGARQWAAPGRGESALGAVPLFVVTRAVIGTIRSAMLEQPALLDAPEFEDQLVALAVQYVEGQAVSPR